MSSNDRRILPDGEMAVRIRNVTALRDAAPVVRASITMCLTARSPMLLWCGPELTLVYNDAAIAVLGDAHPGALGRTVPDEGSERWRTIRSDIERVVAEKSVVHGSELLLSPVFDGDAVVAVAGAPAAGDVDLPFPVASCEDDDTERARVLIVDDDSDMLEYLTSILSTEADVLVASGGTQGLALAAAELPTAIVSDVRMPGLDGIGFVRAVRANPRTTAIPVILMTALNDEPTRTAGLEAGADDYLVKPFNAKELRARLRLQLALARIRAEETTKATRAKDDFLAMVGHELRNPLSTVSTMLQALTFRGTTRELELMGRAVRHLTRLVEDLLESSRLSRGKIELHKQAVEIAQIVDRAVEEVAPLFEERRNKLLVSVPRLGCRVEADADRLARAIANVLTNAAQHTPEGRKIVVDAARDGDRLRLRIADEGSGITPDRIGEVFQAFQTPRTTGGLGLGLGIARSVVELHGGTIGITSPGAGLGTECVIDLVTTNEPVSEPASATRAKKQRLLLVEDNDDAARALKAALEQLGYEVALAHDAPIALMLAKTFEPDVALLDLGLPVMDGWELAKRMQTARNNPLPIVAVTARDQEADKQKSAELGFAEHLVKPIDLPRLQRIVENLSASKRAES
jgi:DNA-binding response OmpR family regulator